MNKAIFPQSHDFYGGITLRDYFAAQALAGIDMDNRYGGFSPASIAKDCYSIADAMLAESEKSDE